MFTRYTCSTCKYFSLRDMDGNLDPDHGFGSCAKGIREASKEFCCNKYDR